MAIQKIKAKVMKGHRVASGMGDDPRYPDGTIRLQLPHFKEHGLDLSTFFPGTLNLDIRPFRFRIQEPDYSFNHIAWSAFIPPENFFFFQVALLVHGIRYHGFIYLPDPATKTDHAQPPDMLEVIAREINDISYGDEVIIEVDEQRLKFTLQK